MRIYLGLRLIVVFLLVNSIVSAQMTDYTKPKLVVLVSIDGLKSEHLTMLYNHFGEGGFKQLINGGAQAQDVEFNYVARNSLSDVASIHTATTPSQHGIVSNKILSNLSNDFYSITSDAMYHGISTTVGRSPHNLMTTTIADMLKLSSPRSKVISIAINAEKAIVMGGHRADAVVWLDTEGNIASTDYYNRLPTWAASLNTSGLYANYLKSSWKPMYSVHTYMFEPYSYNDGYFYNPLPNKSTSELARNFVYTTYANSVVNELAKSAIEREGLGVDSYTDLLCLEYNVNTMFDKSAELASAEKEDLYLSLDRDLAILIRTVSEKIKMDNVLIVLSGTQLEPLSQKSLTELKMPTGKFESKRIIALLNSYLMAKYGQTRWILNYADGNIFLNNDEIDNQNIDRKKLHSDIFAFLSQIQGIAFIASYEQLMEASGDNADVRVRLKNSLMAGRSGDMVLVLTSGWIDTDLDGNESQISNTALQYTPLFFYGINLDRARLDKRYFVTDIAPTICKIVQIPYPNASVGNAIIFKTKR